MPSAVVLVLLAVGYAAASCWKFARSYQLLLREQAAVQALYTNTDEFSLRSQVCRELLQLCRGSLAVLVTAESSQDEPQVTVEGATNHLLLPPEERAGLGAALLSLGEDAPGWRFVDSSRVFQLAGLRDKGEPLAGCVAPLRYGEHHVGVVAVLRRVSRPVQPVEKGIVERVAGHAATALFNVAAQRRLQDKVNEFSALYEVAAMLSASLDLDMVLHSTLESAMALLAADSGCLLLLEPNEQDLAVRAALGMPEPAGHSRVRVGVGPIGWSAQERLPVVVRRVQDDPDLVHFHGDSTSVVSTVCVPIALREKLLGVLKLDSATERDFSRDEVSVLSMIANHAAVAIDNALLHVVTEQMARTDGLTGLVNHREFKEVLQHEMRRAQRFQRPLTLVMFDVDHFKKVNDRYGHPVGDAVLRELANLVRRAVRELDVAARYGGEEFALILLESNAEQGIALAERLRHEVENHVFVGDRVPGGIQVTVSLGVSELADQSDIDELIALADQALYRAKQQGRNQVCLSAPAGETGQADNVVFS